MFDQGDVPEQGPALQSMEGLLFWRSRSQGSLQAGIVSMSQESDRFGTYHAEAYDGISSNSTAVIAEVCFEIRCFHNESWGGRLKHGATGLDPADDH